MQRSIPTIKVASLHPEEEVRVAALSYFAGSFSQDTSIMPLVIQAVERFGRDKAFRIVRKADYLHQTPTTVDWLVSELEHDYDLADLDQDNYRFAIALILYHADVEILCERQEVIRALAMFPAELRQALRERCDTSLWDWDNGWAALQSFAQQTSRATRLTKSDLLYADRIVESLARHWAARGPFVLALLERHGQNSTIMSWMRPWIIRLAGRMRLQAAIPLVVERLCDGDIGVADESVTALIRIDADTSVRAIAERWQYASPSFRAAACDVLENIHTEFCAESCLRFLSVEDDPETRLCLAQALLAQFVPEGIEPVRRIVLDSGESVQPCELDVRHRLVVSSTVLGESFPEYEKWYEEAVADNWGMGDYRPPRLANGFR